MQWPFIANIASYISRWQCLKANEMIGILFFSLLFFFYVLFVFPLLYHIELSIPKWSMWCQNTTKSNTICAQWSITIYNICACAINFLQWPCWCSINKFPIVSFTGFDSHTKFPVRLGATICKAKPLLIDIFFFLSSCRSISHMLRFGNQVIKITEHILFTSHFQ